MYPACYRKLQLGGNQISTLAVYHYPFGRGYNLRYESKGRYTMKKALLALTSLFALATILATLPAQAVQSAKVYTPMEIFVKSCESLQKTWALNTKTTKAVTSGTENIMNGHCYNILTTTTQLVEMGKDAVAFKEICIPANAKNVQILNSIMPNLKDVMKQGSWEEITPAFGLVVALELAYPCKG